MCNNTIFITNITTTSTGVVLIPNRQTLQANLGNLCKYNMIIACGLKSSESLPVFIQTNQGNIPVLDKFGNVVHSNQLRNRCRYCIGYGNNNTSVYQLGQFTIFNNLCCAYSSVAPATLSVATAKTKASNE